MTKTQQELATILVHHTLGEAAFHNYESGKAIYNMLQIIEHEIVSPMQIKTGKFTQSGKVQAQRVINGVNYVVLDNAGHSAGNLVKRIRELAPIYPGLKISRTTMGYSILRPI